MTPPIAIMVRCRCFRPFWSSVRGSVDSVMGSSRAALGRRIGLTDPVPRDAPRDPPHRLCQDEPDRVRGAGHVGAGPLVASAPRCRRTVDRRAVARRGRRPLLGGQAAEKPRRSNPALLDPAHAGYWRREAEVARHPGVVDGPGLVPAEFGAVEEDDEGVTVWRPRTTAVTRRRGCSSPGRSDASRRGVRRAAVGLAPAPGRPARDGRAARRLADPGPDDPRRRDRPALATARALAGALCDEGPQGRLHGDAVPTNFVAPAATTS